jgi:Uri superfamily endonuclease
MRGIYCLIINLKKDISIVIGALGKIKLKKSRYIYIGSAQNNLKKRIKRHLSSTKKIRWHIDYLLSDSHTHVEKVFYTQADKSAECETAALLAKSEECVKGFGCSDCCCISHLFKLKSLTIIEKLQWNIFYGM